MTRRVLVTRPQPGAARTADRLSALGLEPIVLPLSETRPLPVDVSQFPEHIGAVAVTSANALRYAPPEFLERLAGLPCLAVGGQTAQAAWEAGFGFVLEGPGDADGLAQTIVERRIAGPILYLCGRVRRETFEMRLAAAAIAVIAVETYDTAPLEPSVEDLGEIVGETPVDAVLVYSVEAAKAVLHLAGRRDHGGVLEAANFLCLSRRIADMLEGKVRGKILIAREPTEAALLSLLETDG